jgi:hypothetical protein
MRSHTYIHTYIHTTRSKQLKTVASKLGIDPVNRHNENFLLVESITVVKLFYLPEGQALCINMEEFMAEFPEFISIPNATDEKDNLLQYRNLMTVATQAIPAKWNYNHLIDLVARIAEGKLRTDGTLVRYVTGRSISSISSISIISSISSIYLIRSSHLSIFHS